MIAKKLGILKEAKMIDEQTETFVLAVNTYLIEKKVIEEEEHLDMFLTHLAMANMRQKKNESVVKMDALILAEVENDPKLDASKKLWQELESYSSTKFSTDELGFIYMHIINLLNRGK